MELVSQMTVIAFGVGVICFICNLAYNYLYHGASQLLSPNEDKFPDMMEIARCLVLFFCLSIYTPIRAMVAAVVTIDTVFEMIFPASLCPTILEDSQKQLQ